MAAATTTRYVENIHPLHAVLVAGSLPLFLGALLCDWAYWSTYEIQWSNFASWLIVGGLFFSGCALVFVIVDAFRVASHGRGWLAYAVTLLAAWIFANRCVAFSGIRVGSGVQAGSRRRISR